MNNSFRQNNFIHFFLFGLLRTLICYDIVTSGILIKVVKICCALYIVSVVLFDTNCVSKTNPM